MTIRSKFNVIGTKRGKCYDVIESNGKYVKIVLDNGRIAIRHICGFEIMWDNKK